MYLRKQDLETANDDIRAFQKSRAQNWGTSKVLTVITRSINNLFNSSNAVTQSLSKFI
jgi:hypothetical protein